jgi:hypothetical protein
MLKIQRFLKIQVSHPSYQISLFNVAKIAALLDSVTDSFATFFHFISLFFRDQSRSNLLFINVLLNFILVAF